MNVYKIESKNVSYDEDISMVIVAKDKTKALNLAKKNWSFREGKDSVEFIVTKIDITYEQIVDISHYGD